MGVPTVATSRRRTPRLPGARARACARRWVEHFAAAEPDPGRRPAHGVASAGPIGGGDPLALIAGPCVIESESAGARDRRDAGEHRGRRSACRSVFKSSFDKANRRSIDSYRGPGLEEGLRDPRRGARETGLPVLTDVHERGAVRAGRRGLRRAPDPGLPLPADRPRRWPRRAAGRAVNVKKGQFLAPGDMRHVVEKARSAGNEDVLVTERGASFGYNNLVVDMRSFAIMHELGMPGGLRRHPLASSSRAARGDEPAASAGSSSRWRAPRWPPASTRVFMEVHADPEPRALRRPDQLPSPDSPRLLRELRAIDRTLAATS